MAWVLLADILEDYRNGEPEYYFRYINFEKLVAILREDMCFKSQLEKIVFNGAVGVHAGMTVTKNSIKAGLAHLSKRSDGAYSFKIVPRGTGQKRKACGRLVTQSHFKQHQA